MKYRAEATSLSGFIQQLAVSYIGRGYFFYVLGRIPERKDKEAVDEKLIEKYGIERSKASRSRRKCLGFSNVQYIRFRDTFVILATPGKHQFFLEEGSRIRDVREVPLKLFGYAISYRSGHLHVRIEQQQYLELKSYFVETSVHRSKETLERHLATLPFEPYAPVRSQLHSILREANRRRKAAGFELLRSSCIRVRRRIAKPFGVPNVGIAQELEQLFQLVDGDSSLVKNLAQGSGAEALVIRNDDT